jgi:hypothetical protein
LVGDAGAHPVAAAVAAWARDDPVLAALARDDPVLAALARDDPVPDGPVLAAWVRGVPALGGAEAETLEVVPDEKAALYPVLVQEPMEVATAATHRAPEL